MLAETLVVKEEDRFRTLHNEPVYMDEYIEFRRRVLHYAFLRSSDKVYARNLDFEEVLPVSIPSNSSEENALQNLDEIVQAEERGYTLKQIPDSRKLVLTKIVRGPPIMSNYPLTDLSNEEKRQLVEEIAHLTENTVLVDIRPGYPGGNYPLRGYYRFRSF